ncbi:hypothetical protein A1F94_003596 [Pyrenophora tritici-repentis]|nr:hypothetical protein A1F94_003596 [Pyrenophora tritici-repentis]
MLQTTILQSPRSPTRTTSTLLTDASAAALTLNLIGQAIIFGSNQEAYNNNNDEQLQTEEVYMQEWRQEGPLGVLIDVINHIKTPQQHEIFRSFQTAANAELPARERLHVLEPVKPVVTRWNSYYAAFKRATQLQAAYNSYAEHYINALSLKIAALVNVAINS